MVSVPPLSMLPRDDMLLRPLGSDGEPETAAGLITAVDKECEILPRLKIQRKRQIQEKQMIDSFINCWLIDCVY